MLLRISMGENPNLPSAPSRPTDFQHAHSTTPPGRRKYRFGYCRAKFLGKNVWTKGPCVLRFDDFPSSDSSRTWGARSRFAGRLCVIG